MERQLAHFLLLYGNIFRIRVSVRMKQAIGRKELCNMVIGCFILGLLFFAGMFALTEFCDSLK